MSLGCTTFNTSELVQYCGEKALDAFMEEHGEQLAVPDFSEYIHTQPNDGFRTSDVVVLLDKDTKDTIVDNSRFSSAVYKNS